MGFRAQKLKQEEKIKILKRVLLCAVVGVALALCLFSAFVPSVTWKYYFKKPNVGKRKDGELRIHYIDVGQGDATLLELPDGKTMLIDGGAENEATSLMRYLNALKIRTVDYLVLTHTDSDHCGGLDLVVKYKKVKAAYIPCAPEDDNTQYAQFYAELLNEGCQVAFTSRSVEIQGANYKLSFLYPYTYETGEGTEDNYDPNADSAVLWLDYHGVNALFMGDAPSETEELLLRDSALGVLGNRQVDLSSIEILKVAHHGSPYSCSVEFLSTIGVQTAVISCGENNIYGHPASATIKRLQEVGAEIYRTDTQGNILLTIDSAGSYTVRSV